MLGSVTQSAGWMIQREIVHSSQSESNLRWLRGCLGDRVLWQTIIENKTASVSWLAFDGEWISRLLNVAKVRSLKGKYAFVPTSSNAFAARKQLEITAER